jgi:glycosyltransferase involved in cell wall biosynthesis
MPKISVIIPCFNQGPYLDEAVDSVLAQTFQDFEILVVDDGSTDAETIKILRDFARPKTRIIRTENQGLSAARNNGIREAMGEYILPLDADDKIGPGYLEDAVRTSASSTVRRPILESGTAAGLCRIIRRTSCCSKTSFSARPCSAGPSGKK